MWYGMRDRANRVSLTSSHSTSYRVLWRRGCLLRVFVILSHTVPKLFTRPNLFSCVNFMPSHTIAPNRNVYVGPDEGLATIA